MLKLMGKKIAILRLKIEFILTYGILAPFLD